MCYSFVVAYLFYTHSEMSEKSQLAKQAKCSTPGKRSLKNVSPSPKKQSLGKDLPTTSSQSVNVSELSWDGNTTDSNGHVILNLEFPNGGWDSQCSDNDSLVNLEIVESRENSAGNVKSRKRFRSEVSTGDNVILDDMEEEIERQLEAKAQRNNLSVLNVKNILRQVITHPHVLAMVKRSARDGNCTISGDSEDFQYEPKLTRAKAKELLERVKDVDWPMTPCKKPVVSEFEALAIQEMTEDSDDEEYQPGDETSDNECSERDNSELDTPIEQSPAHTDVDDAFPLTPCTPDSTAEKSITTWSEDGIFKVPMTPSENQKDMSMVQDEGTIARRTRSKFSLNDTPLEEIEKAFVPPDVPPGYYEPNVNDATGDNEDWHEFLKEFMEPLPTDPHGTEMNDDDDADPEYNVLADEEIVDKEELRMDRAVKVSRREVNALLAELFEYTENMSSEDDDNANDVTSFLYSSAQNEISSTTGHPEAGVFIQTRVQNEIVSHNGRILPPDKNTISDETMVGDHSGAADKTISESRDEQSNNTMRDSSDEETFPPFLFSLPQRLLLDQQMRQHVQLLTQHYLLTFEHPTYGKYAADILKCLESIRKKAETSHSSSPFRAANLPAAMQVIDDWVRTMHSEKGESIKAFMMREIDKWHLSLLRRFRHRARFPPELMELMSTSTAFVTPQLLPKVPFRCKLSKKIVHAPSELMLIAMGLEEFTHYFSTYSDGLCRYGSAQVYNYISHFLIPTKDSHQLHNLIKREKKKSDSPLKYYEEHKRAPATIHFVFPFSADAMVPPKFQPSYLLPQVWRDYLYPSSVGDKPS